MKKLLLVLLCLLMIGCTSRDSYKKQMNDIIKEWDDAIKIASSTSRVVLSSPVAKLQDIKRKAEKIKVSDSLKNCHQHLLNYMNFNIESFLEFMRSNTVTSEGLIRLAGIEMNEWLECLHPALKELTKEELKRNKLIVWKEEQIRTKRKKIEEQIAGKTSTEVQAILGQPISQKKSNKGQVREERYKIQGEVITINYDGKELAVAFAY